MTVADESDTGEQVSKFVTPRILADTLAVISSIPKAESADADQVAYETFIDAHHPSIGLYIGNELLAIFSSVLFGYCIGMTICLIACRNSPVNERQRWSIFEFIRPVSSCILYACKCKYSFWYYLSGIVCGSPT